MLSMARMGKQRSTAQLSVRIVRRWLSKPIIGKTIAVGLTLSLFNLDLAPALEAKRALEPIAPKDLSLVIENNQTQNALQGGEGARIPQAGMFGQQGTRRPCVVRYPEGYRYYYIDSKDIQLVSFRYVLLGLS